MYLIGCEARLFEFCVTEFCVRPGMKIAHNVLFELIRFSWFKFIFVLIMVQDSTIIVVMILKTFVTLGLLKRSLTNGTGCHRLVLVVQCVFYGD